VSVLLFHPGYIEQLLDIGYDDARQKHDQLEAFLEDTVAEEADPLGLRRCQPSLSTGEAADGEEVLEAETGPSSSTESS
jgi:hypothetical protein